MSRRNEISCDRCGKNAPLDPTSLHTSGLHGPKGWHALSLHPLGDPAVASTAQWDLCPWCSESFTLGPDPG